MRKIAIAMALASTALASPALARDKSWYVGVDGGAMLVEDMDFDVTVGANKTNNALTVDHKTGYDGDVVIGYDFGAFRLEGEAGYREAKVDGLRTAAGTANAVGTTSTMSAMMNALIDFGADDGLQGSIGAGAGYARAEMNGRTAAAQLVHDADKGFAWQALAQVRAPLSDNWDVGLKYRYFNMPDVTFTGVTGAKLDSSIHSHSLMGSLVYNFWTPAPVAPEAPPAPPAPVDVPPAPVAPAPAVCQPGPYIVFFDWDKSDITSEAAATLDNAVSAYNNGCTGTQIMLAGHTDTSGAKQYNMGLSARRNAAVQSYMVSHGINAGAIATQAYGEANLRVQTPDGVRNDQNRRVEITYGPGAGM